MMEKKISVLIVDDEPEARELLTLLLEGQNGVEVAGTAEGVEEAFRLTVERDPDLILLDIQMPGKNGFDLVQMLHEHMIDAGLIFVTAYDEYAIHAIRASAFDYLLKPVDPEELRNAIQRFHDEHVKKNLHDRIGKMLEDLGRGARIKINTRTGFILLDVDEIVYCIASGNYTEIHLLDNRVEIISSNLGLFMSQLPRDRFFRINRSSMINLKYLKQVDNRSGTCRLAGDGSAVLKVARNRRSELENLCAG